MSSFTWLVSFSLVVARTAINSLNRLNRLESGVRVVKRLDIVLFMPTFKLFSILHTAIPRPIRGIGARIAVRVKRVVREKNAYCLQRQTDRVQPFDGGPAKKIQQGTREKNATEIITPTTSCELTLLYGYKHDVRFSSPSHARGAGENSEIISYDVHRAHCICYAAVGLFPLLTIV